MRHVSVSRCTKAETLLYGEKTQNDFELETRSSIIEVRPPDHVRGLRGFTGCQVSRTIGENRLFTGIKEHNWHVSFLITWRWRDTCTVRPDHHVARYFAYTVLLIITVCTTVS